jgi:hypothetical protein
MASALADNLPPTTYGCSPALLLNPSAAPARSSAAALAVGAVGAGGDAAGAELLAVSNVNVHPLVLLSVLDHHSRRQEGAGRVIGTLLGKRDGGVVRCILRYSYFSIAEYPLTNMYIHHSFLSHCQK